MAQTNNIINKLNNLELSIQISLSGLSFCILQRDTNTVLTLKEVSLNKRVNHIQLLETLKQTLNTEEIIQNNFSAITVLHDNNLSALVPKPLFNEDNLADYLKFNSKILVSDFLATDELVINESINIYVPYVSINNFIYDQFGPFTYKHVSTILIEEILNIEKHSTSPKLYVNVSNNHFEIIVVEKSKLILYNTFDYNTKEDFIYYILFTAEQLKLNPETTDLVFLGDVFKGDDIYNIAYKYIRNISFGKRNDSYRYVHSPKSEYSNFTLINSL